MGENNKGVALSRLCHDQAFQPVFKQAPSQRVQKPDGSLVIDERWLPAGPLDLWRAKWLPDIGFADFLP